MAFERGRKSRERQYGPWPGHLARECPHVDLQQIEWKTEENVGTIPYGLLIRTFGPDDKDYTSPVDPTKMKRR